MTTQSCEVQPLQRGAWRSSHNTPPPAKTIQGKERAAQTKLFYIKMAPKGFPGSRYSMAGE